MNKTNNSFGRLGRFSASHPWATIVTWIIIAAIAITVGSSTTAFDPDDDFTGNVESQTAQQIENKAFGSESGSPAVIMIAVFGSFALGRASEMQQMGFGLAIAVFLDVTLIRSILLPATLKLLGKYAWWWPRLLNWVPQIQIEGAPSTPIEVEPSAAG